MVMAATPNEILIYDVRKPSIILKQTCFSHQAIPVEQKDENEINDFDFVLQKEDQSKLKLVQCFDSGESSVTEVDLNTFETKDIVQLKHKHSNICLKCQFSNIDHNTVYTLGFDYKIIQWNLNDISNKS